MLCTLVVTNMQKTLTQKLYAAERPFMHRSTLYAPYSLLLISHKFWMGGGMGGWGVSGREARGQSWRGRIRGVEGENKRGGAGWLSSLIHLSGPSKVN